MRFLAPENFDTPNNKQGHETGHERRIEEEKCLRASARSSFSSRGFWDWRIIMVRRIKVPIAQERYIAAAGNWMMVCGESRLNSFFSLRASSLKLTRCESLRKNCEPQKTFPSASSENEERTASSISCFRGFSIPSFSIDFKTCRHSSDCFSPSCLHD